MTLRRLEVGKNCVDIFGRVQMSGMVWGRNGKPGNKLLPKRCFGEQRGDDSGCGGDRDRGGGDPRGDVGRGGLGQ